MGGTVDEVRQVVCAIEPFDAREADDRARALDWLASTDDVFRRRKPDVPSPHLVAYVVVRSPDGDEYLLVDHRIAGLALPPGGHVEPGELPETTAARELGEELGVEVPLDDHRPAFVTWTTTVGQDRGHVDVTLWFTITVDRSTSFDLDPTEFTGGRWWSADEIAAAPDGVIEPELARFVAKTASIRCSGGTRGPRPRGRGRASGW